MESVVYNCDCLELMRSMPDKSVELVIADPPYLPENENTGTIRTTGNQQSNLVLGGAPTKEVFDEIFRVSKHQIIWGANNFGYPFQGFVVWEKTNIPDDFTMSRCEIASLDKGLSRVSKMIRISSAAPKGEKRIHPCLPAGEKVYFNNEWINIEDVKIGYKNDYGTVVSTTNHVAENLVEIEVGGLITTATYNHPFLILRKKEIAWCEAEQITNDDFILWNENLQKKDTLGINITECCVSNTTLYGNNITEKSQEENKSTISMGIKPIIELKTSCLSHHLNTNGYTVVAKLSEENGINNVVYVENSNHAQRISGISTELGLQANCVKNVTLKNQLKFVKFSLQKVGSVKTIQGKRKVYNLTIHGLPVFDTLIGISHNTEKPIELYGWLLNKYAKKGWRILDPFLGSGSSRIACDMLGFDFVGCEIDKTFYDLQEERFKNYKSQMKLFTFENI